MGEYEAAIQRFRAAEEHVHAPPHVLYLARSHAKLGQLLEARELYRSLADEQLGPRPPRAFAASQKAARKELEKVEEAIPRVAITVVGPANDQVELTIDGAPVNREALGEPVELDPGRYLIRVEAEGYEPAQERIKLDPGEGTRKLRLAPVRLPEPVGEDEEEEDDDAGGQSPAAAAVLLGIGVAGLVAGGVTGGLALSRASDLRGRCPTNPCPPDNEALADEAHAFGTVATVGIVSGGLLTMAGLTWLLWAADEPADETGEEDPQASIQIEPVVGPGFAGVGGVF